MKTFTKISMCALVLTLGLNVQAQHTEAPKKEESKKKWYDQIGLRGYTQIRYNKLFETNDKLTNEQGDKSWGGNNSFFMRRGRLIFSGQVHEHVYIYIQPDFASTATDNHFFQIRDAYFDLSLDKDKEFRFRIGQSKVPYGFENMQSSSNRLTLDRNDALNSAVSNERDLGVFFYWATKEKRELLKKLVDTGLKGSGDYGLFGIGLYNGQLANKAEQNATQHAVARFTYPFEFKNGQIFEAGIQGYTGQYVLTSTNPTTTYTTTSSTVTNDGGLTYVTTSTTTSSTKDKAKLEGGNKSFLDQRAAVSAILYPQPFGIQAEYTVGKGPEYDVASNTIKTQDLKGGYVQLMYKKDIKGQTIIPFVKHHWYDGGKKQELDARSYKVNDYEIGVEWQPFKNFELTADYTISDRDYVDSKTTVNHQKGNLLRLQAQFNF